MKTASQYLKYMSEPTYFYVVDACQDREDLIEQVSYDIIQLTMKLDGSFMELADEALSKYGL